MMTERTKEMNHKEFDLLLPWYVNGTLSEEDRNRIEIHLKGCATYRQEVKLLHGLEQAVKQARRKDL